MTLNLNIIPINNLTKRAVFNNIIISQDISSGNMDMYVSYYILIEDSSGKTLQSDMVSIRLSQSEIMAFGDFNDVYNSLKVVARQTLQSKYPELVIAT